ncbi:acetyltransferase [Desulforhopalus singaporensis]|uniref:Acetyltransferase n=1 Tax=Desulforhopalus singaporensis TaxID=91360 RepID=A0A1H0NBB5_9BACT|nr:acetyltransferase [Desulforhopalus singaporensis]SDO89725.1 hypothetical protein SAMN05660330_01323 [Desulforhopalus singaporensis]
MEQYDIFNGDADGIFALHQYRLKYPENNAVRITGVKRDIGLLRQIEGVKNCSVTVFDISFDSNRKSVDTLLADANHITYFDHHFCGNTPHDSRLTAHINPSADTCTSIIVNDTIGGEYGLWAICGAFGDNLQQQAAEMTSRFHLDPGRTSQLKELGELFNYNGYGADIQDLHFHPDNLYQAVAPYRDPFAFIADSEQLLTLRHGYHDDMASALGQPEYRTDSKNRVFIFPDAPWARRVSGVFSNLKAVEKGSCAHAIISENPDGSFRVSVRAPLDNKRNADTLCRQFPTGGGRAGSAGINQLPKSQFDLFIETFLKMYPD